MKETTFLKHDLKKQSPKILKKIKKPNLNIDYHENILRAPRGFKGA